MVVQVQNEVISVKKAIDDFLLSCKVEGRSYGTIECYSDKLKGFLWYCNNYGSSDLLYIRTSSLNPSFSQFYIRVTNSLSIAWHQVLIRY